MNDLLSVGSAALKKAALNEDAKEYLLNNKVLYPLLKKAADRYIGGETLDDAVEKVKAENNKGLKCSLEFMGESTSTKHEANEATNEFLRIASTIQSLELNSTISLDLSHIGLAISKALCIENFSLLCDKARQANIEVIISAEGIDRTDHVIDVYQWGIKKFDNLSITLQAYLHRTKDDFADLIKESGRIRVVKGAFDVPDNTALPRGDTLNEVYLSYVDQLLAINHKCSIATHHEFIQQEAKKLVDLYKPEKSTFEFESLYGIQTEQLLALKNEGYPTKLYFVYGKEWYLYLCNRIAEYPLNLFRALDDIVN
ncbi:proline dehydrogenase family protein [Endozoicomonas sp. SM1973]|uniref:proline dehydrogenase n=1 Tax=Spartinivicinus marinus TaxID=2994442 RepID=A0A853I0C5_9GAMM|nr:proline dehydrogenase family protein [Spartinivicinus marinus]MCX4027229.1 proline dehydrogenase family protein [Spartinivicinus marinus]NYZ66049.1 proline dehydrogenase family protein [Spartinivicinus marinus]